MMVPLVGDHLLKGEKGVMSIKERESTILIKPIAIYGDETRDDEMSTYPYGNLLSQSNELTRVDYLAPPSSPPVLMIVQLFNSRLLTSMIR